MKELIEEFLSDLRKKGAANATASAYWSDLVKFTDFCSARLNNAGNLKAINQRILRDYLGFLKRNGYSISTIKRKFSVLRSFFKWLRIWSLSAYRKLTSFPKINRKSSCKALSKT